MDFFSKKLGPKRRISSTYHKELYAIVEAVQKWRQYLLGREFVIRSDQKNLKDLLQQIIQTPDQQFYARKLMGYKFRIEYKTGASNKVADALSRRDVEVDQPLLTADGEPEQAGDPTRDAQLLTTVAQPVPEVLGILQTEAESAADVIELRSAQEQGRGDPDVSFVDGLCYYKRRLYVSKESAVKEVLLREFHAAPTAGHPGIDRTFKRLAAVFYWKGMRKDVKKFVESCYDCQTTKYSTQKPAGLLQPLPIPSQVCEDVSIDFITCLPQSRGFTTILVAVDRLTKYAHFAPLPKSYNALKVATVFIDTVVKHHGISKTLVSDRDPVFLNEVWEDMLRLSGTKLNFSTVYHPQSDGQTEVRNRGLEQYLRAFVADRPSKWVNFLPWAELALNCFHHEGLGTSPFTALYGRDPPSLIAAAPSAETTPDVALMIRQRGELIVLLRKNLERAQQRMRVAANKHRRDVEFEAGEMVLLKLQMYRQHSVARPLSTKLARRFYGPFKVLERIGQVAYRLKLPEGNRVHDVFHVSLLKPFVVSENRVAEALPAKFARGRPVVRPCRVRDRRTVWRNGETVEELLLESGDDGGDQPSWEPREVVHSRFPDLLLEDKEASKERGVVTVQQSARLRETSPEQHVEEMDVDTVDKGSKETTRTIAKDRSRRQRRQPDHFGDFVNY